MLQRFEARVRAMLTESRTPILSVVIANRLAEDNLKPPRGWLEHLLMRMEDVRFRDATGASNNCFFLANLIADDPTVSAEEAAPPHAGASGHIASIESVAGGSAHHDVTAGAGSAMPAAPTIVAGGGHAFAVRSPVQAPGPSGAGVPEGSSTASMGGPPSGVAVTGGAGVPAPAPAPAAPRASRYAVVPAREAHINPPIGSAERVILIDLENQAGALTFVPNATDFVEGFLAGNSPLIQRAAAARYRIHIEAGYGPDFADISIVWRLSQLVYEEHMPRLTHVVVISADNIFQTLSAVVRHTVRVLPMTWQLFSAGPESSGD